jgi:methylated-DNA-protein-cysteine methyltransferase related protein
VTADAARDRRLLDVVRALLPGEVSTYGDIAATAGHPGRARLVGRLLATADDEDLPWWRVVTSSGRLVPGAEVEQAARLRADGVVVRAGRVVDAPIGRFRRSTSRSARRRA